MNCQHPSERDLSLPAPAPASRSGIETWTRCYCFGVGSDESQTSTSGDYRVATAGDESPVVQGGSTSGTGGSFVTGAGSKYSESGSILADTANVGNIQAGGDVTIGLKGGEVGSLVDSFNRASSDEIGAFNALLRKEQDTVVELAGDSKKNNAFAWIAVAAIAALVLPGLITKLKP